MVTQNVQFVMPEVSTPLAKIFVKGSDTIVESVTPTLLPNSKLYLAAFTDVSEGVYTLVGFDDTTQTAVWEVVLKLVDGTYYAYESGIAESTEFSRLAAAGATGTVGSVDNGNGTFSLTFYDTDGVTQLSTATYTTATGDRTRTS